MSARKSKERQAKKHSRIKQGKILAGVEPGPVPALQIAAPHLSPQNELLLLELRAFASDVILCCSQLNSALERKACSLALRPA